MGSPLYFAVSSRSGCKAADRPRVTPNAASAFICTVGNNRLAGTLVVSHPQEAQMSTAYQFREYAVACWRHAWENPANRDKWMALAAQWMLLASQADGRRRDAA